MISAAMPPAATHDDPRPRAMLSLRRALFQIHKWIGILLAIAIIPISVTGALLVWHDGLDEWLHPDRVVAGAAALPVERYADAAHAALRPGEQLLSLDLPGDGAVRATAWRPPTGEGRPVRTQMWLAPDDARLLDTAASDAGLVRFMHVLHGSLFIPEWGRPIVGWVGVAMLLSSISGLWLWWPTVGSWLRGLRWRRQRHFDGNLHHLLGFWIAVPLFVLSLTGVWISFPKIFSAFDAQSASAGPGGRERPQGAARGGEPSREQRMRARPLANPAVSLAQAVAVAQARQPGVPVARIGWPTDVEPQWTIATGPEERDRQTEIKIDAASGDADVKPPRNEPETLSRLMRRIHDGDDMGLLWQTVIFLGGLLPAILSITGLIMWWRARGWRGDLKRRQRAKAAAA